MVRISSSGPAGAAEYAAAWAAAAKAKAAAASADTGEGKWVSKGLKPVFMMAATAALRKGVRGRVARGW